MTAMIQTTGMSCQGVYSVKKIHDENDESDYGKFIEKSCR